MPKRTTKTTNALPVIHPNAAGADIGAAEIMAKALVGDGRDEPLCPLGQALAAYRHSQQLITDGDHEIEPLLGQFDSQGDPAEAPWLPPTTTHRQPQRHQMRWAPTDLRTALSRSLGVDLTPVPGWQTPTIHTLFTALGWELSALPTAQHVAAWLGLCPDTRGSGGRVLSAKTRNVRSRAADALRLAAQRWHHSKSALGEFSRRMRARRGAPQAITTTAHTLARMRSHLLTTGHAEDETVVAQDEERYWHRRVQRLPREAAALGDTLAPKASVS